MEHADRCQRLAELLTDNPEGKPLAPEDKALIRVALYQRFNGVAREMGFFFLSDNKIDVERSIIELRRILEATNQM